MKFSSSFLCVISPSVFSRASAEFFQAMIFWGKPPQVCRNAGIHQFGRYSTREKTKQKKSMLKSRPFGVKNEPCQIFCLSFKFLLKIWMKFHTTHEFALKLFDEDVTYILIRNCFLSSNFANFEIGSWWKWRMDKKVRVAVGILRFALK